MNLTRYIAQENPEDRFAWTLVTPRLTVFCFDEYLPSRRVGVG